jgi:hypothetical protein
MIRVTRQSRYSAPGGAGTNPFDLIREAAAQKRTKVPPGPVRALALGGRKMLSRVGEEREAEIFQNPNSLLVQRVGAAAAGKLGS